ncbi:MAG: hypothetical protein ABIA93_05805 [Candidatus Woesearchaeota archaeon]
MIKHSPVSSGSMLFSIIAFLIGAVYIMPISINWGTIIVIVSALLFVASIINMVNAPDEELAIHRRKKK